MGDKTRAATTKVGFYNVSRNSSAIKPFGSHLNYQRIPTTKLRIFAGRTAL